MSLSLPSIAISASKNRAWVTFHWVALGDGLFLVYTGAGANNDPVIRLRAPLFTAQVDPRRLVVIRATEKILVQERGADGSVYVVKVKKAVP